MEHIYRCSLAKFLLFQLFRSHGSRHWRKTNWVAPDCASGPRPGPDELRKFRGSADRLSRRRSGHVDPVARRGRCLARRVRVELGHRRRRYRPAINLGESVSSRSMAPAHGSRAMGDPRGSTGRIFGPWDATAAVAVAPRWLAVEPVPAARETRSNSTKEEESPLKPLQMR